MAVILSTEEEKWWRDHPAPESTPTGETLTLWNYPVARTQLVPAHKAAIDKFLEIESMMRAPSVPLAISVSIRGHASPTGENAQNSDLALARAQAVRSYLFELGAQKERVVLSSAGASEPLDGDRSGPALARNRRVVIVKFRPAQKQSDMPAFLADDDKIVPQENDPAIKGVQGEYKKTLGPVPLMKTPFLVDASLTGVFKAYGQITKKGLLVGGTVLEKGKFSGKAEAEIVKNVAAKFTIAPPKDGQGLPSIKVGAQFKELIGKPEFGIQKLPKFVFIKFESPGLPLSVDPLDPASKVEFKGEVKFDVGLGAAMVQRLAQLEALLGGTTAAEGFTLAELEAAGIGGSGGILGATAAVGAAIGVAALVIGGVIYFAHDAKEEADTYCALLARRDGKSARVAWEILGADRETNYLQREKQWTQAIASTRMLDAFRQGRKDAEVPLKVEGARDAKVAAWKAKYASDATTDFSVIRARVYEDLGGLDKNPLAGASL